MERTGTSKLQLQQNRATGEITVGFELNPQMAYAANQWRDYFAALGRPMSSVMTAMQDAAAVFCAQFPKLQAELTQRAWFVSAETPVTVLRACEEAFADRNVSVVDESMAEFTDSRVDVVAEVAVRYFPARKLAVDSAFGAHRRGEYWCSIPLLLSQADGLCRDMLNAQLYSKTDRNRRQLDTALRPLSDQDTLAILLNALRISGPLNASFSEMTQYPGMLNRHEVFHGSSTVFGTRLNSLKSISLIDFLMTVVWEQAR
jgi:hypothetical protein